MPSVEESIRKDASEVAERFSERVSLSPWEMRPTYWTFRVTEVNGRKPSHLVLASFYDDQIYLPAHLRAEGKLLSVFDMGPAEKPSRYAVASWNERTTPFGEQASLLEMLEKAHRRAWRGPRFKELNPKLIGEEAQQRARAALGL